ncbi:Ras-responsive element-binding protein 1, partial [Frankliniella fusca]
TARPEPQPRWPPSFVFSSARARALPHRVAAWDLAAVCCCGSSSRESLPQVIESDATLTVDESISSVDILYCDAENVSNFTYPCNTDNINIAECSLIEDDSNTDKSIINADKYLYVLDDAEEFELFCFLASAEEEDWSENLSPAGTSAFVSNLIFKTLFLMDTRPSQRLHLMCTQCAVPTFLDSAASLNNHYLKSHPHLVSYTCGKCKKSFMHKTSLIRHIREAHIDHEDSDNDDDEEVDHGHVVIPQQDGNESFDSNGEDNAHQANNPDGGNNAEQITDEAAAPFDLKAEAALFLMKLRSAGNITHASVRLIQTYVEELLKNILHHVEEKTSDFLKECAVPPEQSAPFLTGDTFNLGNPFEGLESIEEQLNYFCDKFGMVIPEEMYLGSYRIENRYDREKRVFIPKQVSETFQFVSAIETLKFIVRNSYLRKLIESEQPSTDGVYRNYKDGTDFKTNPFLQRFPNAIRIVIYTDDLEISNPLGSKDCIHKLGAFYICVQNLPPEESSQLASVFLLALSYAEDLKVEGNFAKILKCFVDELKILMSDEGVVVDVPEGGTYTIRACLVCLCADSLAAHALLGFMSPSAKKFCRLCMLSLDDLKEDSAAIGQLRTSALHQQQVAQVEARTVQGKTFGILERSCLEGSMRVPEDSALDAFHDLVGVIQMDIKLALYEFTCVRKLFTVPVFNNSVNMFNYGTPDRKNKPSANFLKRKLCDNGHSLRQSGSQTFCLLRIFPFLISGVQSNDPSMKLIHLLQDIVQIIFSFKLREIDISRLEYLVTEHNNLFHQLFVRPEAPEQEQVMLEEEQEGNVDDPLEGGDEEIDDDVEEEDSEDGAQTIRRRLQSKKLKKGINKMHHLVHYGQQMREKGPMIRLWCAKFEGRHRIFRKHSGVQNNFKNPPKTMARMFQLATLGSTRSKTKSRQTQVHLSGATTGLVRHNAYRDIMLLKGLQDEDEVKLAQSVEVCGLVYQSGLFVALTGGTEWQPTFGLITDIIVLKKDGEWSKIVLVVIRCQNQGRSAMYNCFSVSDDFTAPVSLVDREDLLHHRPIAPWTATQPSQPAGLHLYPRELLF